MDISENAPQDSSPKRIPQQRGDSSVYNGRDWADQYMEICSIDEGEVTRTKVPAKVKWLCKLCRQVPSRQFIFYSSREEDPDIWRQHFAAKHPYMAPDKMSTQ